MHTPPVEAPATCWLGCHDFAEMGPCCALCISPIVRFVVVTPPGRRRPGPSVSGAKAHMCCEHALRLCSKPTAAQRRLWAQALWARRAAERQVSRAG